ncbi:hypothetical protein E2C01_100930 [Portunus trituberculatus]|uniref:Uncharacterized protein n=1 Tax=Portunus trituberculatus TaxID=210409 RepID=A0A5B7KJ61_PORTR|nr:hypothetical protein [Portunus trituberculatus]
MSPREAGGGIPYSSPFLPPSLTPPCQWRRVTSLFWRVVFRREGESEMEKEKEEEEEEEEVVVVVVRATWERKG